MAFAAVALAVVWQLADARVAATDTGTGPEIGLFEAHAGWTPSKEPITPWLPRIVGDRARIEQVFEKGPVRVGLIVAYFRDQAQGRELVGWQNNLAPTTERRWLEVASGEGLSAWGERSETVHAASIRVGDTIISARQWYWIDGRMTSSDYLAKALLVLQKLTGHGDDGAYVVIYTDATGSQADAARALDDFGRAMGAAVDTRLSERRGE